MSARAAGLAHQAPLIPSQIREGIIPTSGGVQILDHGPWWPIGGTRRLQRAKHTTLTQENPFFFSRRHRVPPSLAPCFPPLCDIVGWSNSPRCDARKIGTWAVNGVRLGLDPVGGAILRARWDHDLERILYRRPAPSGIWKRELLRDEPALLGAAGLWRGGPAWA